MRILLVDDHGLFLEGLKNLLMAGGYEVVGTAYDGFEGLKLARSLKPDLILMDVRMPNCDGLKSTRLIKAELPEIQIVMLTTSDVDGDLFEAIKSGASGYLLKNLHPNVLFHYLEGLSRGEAPLSRELSAYILHEFSHQISEVEQYRHLHSEGADRHSDDESDHFTETESGTGITPRQREILEMVVDGLTYKEIGATLHLSEYTVKYHMGQIVHRLHVKNREQVVAYALQTGLVCCSERISGETRKG